MHSWTKGMAINLDTLEMDDMQQKLSRTEDSAERGYSPHDPQTHDPRSYADLGKSEQLDDQAGDIADEGAGHRG